MIKTPSEIEITQNWVGDVTKPIVSISCITYNHEKYIEEAIVGFLTQKTNFPFKIFILDDASSDQTSSIIRKYESKYPKLFFYYLLKENTWQKPIREEMVKPFLTAREIGKYIALCEGDDYWTDPYKLQKQVDFLEAHPQTGVVHTDASILFEDSGAMIRSNNQRLNRSIPQGNIFKDLINGNFIQTLTVVMRKEAFKYAMSLHSNILNNSKASDYVMWLSISTSWEIHYLNDVTAVYRSSANTASRPKELEKKIRFQDSIFNVKEFFIKHFANDENLYRKIHQEHLKFRLKASFDLQLKNYLSPEDWKQVHPENTKEKALKLAWKNTFIFNMACKMRKIRNKIR